MQFQMLLIDASVKCENRNNILNNFTFPLIVRSQDDVLAGELSFHQGCLQHAPAEDAGMDGECGEGHLEDHG